MNALRTTTLFCTVFTLAHTWACSKQASSRDAVADGDEIVTPPQQLPATIYTARLRVVDVDRTPVAGAGLTLNGQAVQSDANGMITVPDLPLTGSLIGVIKAPGFMPLPVKVSSTTAKDKPLSVTLAHPEMTATIDASLPATVALHAGKISFAANTFVTASATSGAQKTRAQFSAGAATGDISLTGRSIDPAHEVFETYDTSVAFGIRADFDPSSVPTGASTIYLSDGTTQNAYPEASLTVLATDANGVAVDLSNDLPATVRLPLTSFTAHQLGARVPLLNFDETGGFWAQQGHCTVEPSTQSSGPLECVGTVSKLGTIGVPATEASPGFPCTNFQISFADDLQVDSYTAWAEEVITAGTSVKARNTATTDNGSLCYIGGSQQVKLIVQARIGASTTIFTSDVVSPANVLMSRSDLADFDAGSTAHACFKCGITPVTLAAANGNAGTDDDNDGYFAYTNSSIGYADCDDQDATTHPGAPENVCDQTDKNCDGAIPSGSATVQSAANPATWNTVYCKLACAEKSAEVPGNAIDENCDGIISDQDNDGFFSAADPAFAAARANAPSLMSDCDDGNAQIYPGASEVAGNSVDEDCDGFAIDADGDGTIAPAQHAVSLAHVQNLGSISDESKRFTDCQDWDPNVYFGAAIDRRESVLTRFYVDDLGGGIHRAADLCHYIGVDGTLNAAGKSLLRDVNCDGLYSDLDGDGYTVPGDVSLGDANDIDCNDFDPRLNVQSDCLLDANITFGDGGTCAPGGASVSGTCASGLEFSVATGACEDINECATTPSVCSSQQSCLNKYGSYSCVTTVAPLVAGTLQAVAQNANTIAVAYPCATGGDGNVTYSVYTHVGPFAPYTAADIAAQGQLAASTTSCGDTNALLVAGTPGVIMSVAVVAVDSAGSMAVYAPQNVQMPMPLLAGTLSASLQGNTTLSVAFDAASGGSAPYFYYVYTIVGSFSPSTIASVEASGLLQVQTNIVQTLTLPGLQPGTTYSVALIAVDQDNDKVLYPVQSVATPSAPSIHKKIFPVVTSGANLGGVIGADAICQDNMPVGVAVAKAIITDGTNRIACTSPNCSGGGTGEHTNWVLLPQTTYVRPDGTEIGTTSAAGIFLVPLLAPLAGPGEAGEWWSGFDPAWVSSGSHCQIWSTSSGAATGDVGMSVHTDSRSISIYNQYCDRPNFVLCAEQ